MNSRAFWAFAALAALTLAAAYWWRNKVPPPTPASGIAAIAAKPNIVAPSAIPPAVAAPSNATPTATATAMATTPTTVAEKKPKPEVAIQDGKTIDFSSGVAVVKDDAKQKAAIDKAVKEMDSALQGVTFAPPAQKEAEPTPAPPKP